MIQIGIIAFLILIVGALTFALHSSEYAGSTTMQIMALLMGVAAVYFIVDSKVRKSLLSGVGPFDAEALTFDTKFDDLKVSGRISGKLSASDGEDKLKF